MTKLKPIAVAVLVASASTVATANVDAPAPPTFYDLGPTSPLTNETDISYAERKAYAGMEALMTILEARVHDWGCSGGPYDVEVVADFEGVGPNADATNYAKLDQVALLMDLAVEDPLRGQTVNILQDGAMGTVGGKLVTGYTSALTFNADNNLMDGTYSMMLLGRNGPDSFAGYVIKDFYLGDPADGGGSYGDDIVYDWGLQSLHKANYPVEKYWQRSKSRRSNTFWGKTVFQKDRLVGFTPCRIVIDIEGYNISDWFEQYGTATITRATPADPTLELDAVKNVP